MEKSIKCNRSHYKKEKKTRIMSGIKKYQRKCKHTAVEQTMVVITVSTNLNAGYTTKTTTLPKRVHLMRRCKENASSARRENIIHRMKKKGR